MPLHGPDLQALDRRVVLRLSRRQLHGVDALAAEFGMSRSWFLREVFALGLPLAEARIRQLLADGFRPAGDAGHRPASGPRRGPYSDGRRPDRWVHAPHVPRRRRPVPDPGYEED